MQLSRSLLLAFVTFWSSNEDYRKRLDFAPLVRLTRLVA